MSGTDQAEALRGVGLSAFAEQLQLRLVAARECRERAEADGDELLAQIAEADLSELRALAARNDIEVAAA